MSLVRVHNQNRFRMHTLGLLISQRIHPYYDYFQDRLDVESANLGLNHLVLNATSACAKT